MGIERNGAGNAGPGQVADEQPDPGVAAASRAAARLSKSLEVGLGEVGLSLPQYRLLAFLAGGPERASALAEWLSVSPPSLTALVDGAVGKGLVQRVAVQDDRRAVRHVLTDRGREALADGDEAVAARLADLTARLTPAEARRVIDGLQLLGKALDAAREERDAERAAGRAVAR